MSAFSFDEMRTTEDNLALFFEHLRSQNADFANLLERELPRFVREEQDRKTFNTAVIALIDTERPQEGGPGT